MHLCRLPLSSENKMKFNSYGTANSFGWTTTERYCLTAIFLSPQNPFLTHFGQTKAIQADPLDQLAATLGKQISACMAQISLFSTCLDIFNFHEWLATLYIFVNNKWASLFVDCGRQEAGGRRGVGWGKICRRGRTILDASRKGDENYWTSPEGAGQPYSWSIFFNVPKTQLFHFFRVFWALFWSRGPQNYVLQRGMWKLFSCRKKENFFHVAKNFRWSIFSGA